MKRLLTMLIAFSTAATFGQNIRTVDLRWKIAKNEKLSYSTVMKDIDTSTIEMNFGGVFKGLSDSTQYGLKETKDFLRKASQALNSQDYLSTLTNKSQGVIEVVMTIKPKEQAKDTKADTTHNKETGFMKMMQSMNQGIVLRGSVYETGGIHSFWVKSNQKNLIALFFELPTKPVKIGDKWSLDVDLIGNDQNFECDSANKTNEVTLTDIKNVNGETIAVLKYNIVEYVKGNFNSPSFFGNAGGPKETMMKYAHQGIAEFSVDKGRWVTYDAIMSLDATGVMTANKKTKLALVNTSK